MFTLQLNLIEDHFAELEKRLKQLAKSESTTGYFIEQGKHEGTTDDGKREGMYYTDLVGYHATGWPSGGLVARPIFEIAHQKFTFKDTSMKKDLTTYLKDIKAKSAKITTDKIHENFIKDLSDEIVDIFGDPSQLPSNKDSTIKQKKVTKSDSPLVDTKELRDALSYKIDGSSDKLTKNLG